MGRPKGEYPEGLQAYNERRKQATQCKRGHLYSGNLTADKKCRLCQQLTSKAYAEKHKERMKVWYKFNSILKAYGLSQEEYETKLQGQEGRCAVCRILMTTPCVDHDHETNQVRDLLCKPCNLALGFIREDVEIAKALVAYLRKWKP